jgi:hypothetical protein
MPAPEHWWWIASRGQLLIDALGVELCSFVAMLSCRLLPESLIRSIRHSGKAVQPNPVSSSFRRTESFGSREATCHQLPKAPWDPVEVGTTRTVTVAGLLNSIGSINQIDALRTLSLHKFG